MSLIEWQASRDRRHERQRNQDNMAQFEREVAAAALKAKEANDGRN